MRTLQQLRNENKLLRAKIKELLKEEEQDITDLVHIDRPYLLETISRKNEEIEELRNLVWLYQTGREKPQLKT